MLKEEKSRLTSLLKNNLVFNKVIKKLTISDVLDKDEKTFILSCALLFLKEYDLDRRYKSYADLSFYIILKYSIKYSDYKPLYDFATAFGFYPISNEILKNHLLPSENLNDFFVRIQLNNYRKEIDKEKFYIETIEQHDISQKFIDDEIIQKGFVAPTSFGKSSIIIDFIRSLKSKSKIAIIVPTKSLLAQTYRMIRDAKLDYKILIHDEMYNDEENFIAIFTQERALRLIKKRGVSYGTLIIDEAHNIMNNNDRSVLISRLLRMNMYFNPDQRVLYLSPLIDDIKNIRIHENQVINSHKIDFNIKSPEIFEYRIDNSAFMHNRFFITESNRGYPIGKYENHLDYLIKKSGHKNFLYNYRPIFIEDLAKKVAQKLTIIDENEKIREVIDILKSEVHEKFYCIDLLKKGVIYLHGKIPDLIKEYLEKKFNDIDEIKFVVANSVILEGINLPIDRLFIFNTYGLQGKELTNLIGRVNRLNEIFGRENNLYKLLPQVHFVNNKLYNRTLKDNMFNKIKLLRSRSFEDKISNPTLANFDFDGLKEDTEANKKVKEKARKIRDYEDFIITKQVDEKARLMQYFIEAGFDSFFGNLDKLIDSIHSKISDSYYSSIEWKNEKMLDKIYFLFISDFVNEDGFFKDYEFSRLEGVIARKYYEMMINYRKKSLKENISILFKYLSQRRASEDRVHHIYYIGSAYGEQKYNSEKYFDELKTSNVAIDLSKKTDKELVNYAIVKLKIEEDFISFKLNKFIVFLYDYSFINEEEYNIYIYGTNDANKIALTKFGLNIGLIAKLHDDNQLGNLQLDNYNNLKANEHFKRYLKSLNDFQRFEIERFIN